MANIVHRKGEPVGRGLGSPPTDDNLIRGLGSPPSQHVTHPYGVVKQHYHMEEVPQHVKCALKHTLSTSDSCGSVSVSPHAVGAYECTLSAGPEASQAPASRCEEAVDPMPPTSFINSSFNLLSSTPSPEPSGVVYDGEGLPLSREGNEFG